MLSRADDPEAVRIAVDGVHDYRTFFDQTGMGSGSNVGNMAGGSDEGKSLEDLFYQKEMELSKLAFTRQFTYSVVYSWVKLREQVRVCSSLLSIINMLTQMQEIRNITWIAECIAQNQKDRIGNYISVF